MGDLIILAERKADRSRPSRGPAAFFFSLGCPISYLAAERVERAFGEIEWLPLPRRIVIPGPDIPPAPGQAHFEDELLAAAEREAGGLRLPLVVPERLPFESREASRAAVFAAEQGAGRAFALAASRMIFCGGYDLDDPEVIAEAAAAAGLPVSAVARAAGDSRYDATLDATLEGLRRRGLSGTPVIRIGNRWFEGLEAVPGASSFAAVSALYDGALTPAG